MATYSDLDEQDAGNEAVNQKQAADLVLCYLACPTDGGGGFVGAILLTDHRVRPQHFAFVQPVRPTKMQRILYGSTLDEHLKIDVIGRRLWEGLPKKPDVLFVDAPDLIAVRRVANVPTALIAKNPDSETNSSSLSILRYDVGPNTGDQTRVGEIIGLLEQTCSLLEPFARIQQALREALRATAQT